MNWKYIQKLVTVFKSIWEKFIQNRPVYKNLLEEHQQITVALGKACQEIDKLQIKHEHTEADLTETRDNLSTLQARYDKTTADLTETQHNLKSLHEEHNQTTTDFNKLKEEHKHTTATLDETRDNYSTLEEEYEHTKADLTEAHKRLTELDDLTSKYELVSHLLTPQFCENEELEKFKKFLEVDFMNFANKEFSLAAEASAVQRLQRLEKQLEEVVAFPHTFTKKSIAIGGGFSSGKSEFVNSFITGNVKLPVGLNPTTAIPSFVVSSSKVSIKGVSRNGATVDIEPEFYTRMSRDFIKKIKNFMPYMTVEVPLVKGSFKNICLIDTPGYDPAGESEDKSIATDFLKDRDALIWIIPATTGTIPQEDLKFIDDLELNGIPFYVVLSKAELPSERELEGILDEVKEALDEEDIEYVGISVYSAICGKEYLYDKICLDEFFASQNKPIENMRTELRKEIEKVFLMYEEAIYEDEKTAKKLVKQLSSLNFGISSELGFNTLLQDLTYQCRCGKSFYIPNLQRKVNKVMKEVMADYQCPKCDQNLDLRRLDSSDLNLDSVDGLTEKIDNIIKEYQNKDFTEIKREMREIKKNMLKAVDNVFWSLSSQSLETIPRPQPNHRSRQKSSRQGKKKSEKPPFTNPLPPPVQKTRRKA